MEGKGKERKEKGKKRKGKERKKEFFWFDLRYGNESPPCHPSGRVKFSSALRNLRRTSEAFYTHKTIRRISFGFCFFLFLFLYLLFLSLSSSISVSLLKRIVFCVLYSYSCGDWHYRNRWKIRSIARKPIRLSRNRRIN